VSKFNEKRKFNKDRYRKIVYITSIISLIIILLVIVLSEILLSVGKINLEVLYFINDLMFIMMWIPIMIIISMINKKE
jgi:hypothetical protein